MTLDRVLMAMEELEKWERKMRDIEKMLAALRRRKKELRSRIEAADKEIEGYNKLLETEKREIPDISAGFPAGRQ